MDNLKEHSLYTFPPKIKKIEEVYRESYTCFQENDLLLAKLGGCFENGKMSIAKNLANGVGFGSTEFIVLRAKKGILIEWIYYYLKNSNFFEEGKETMTGTTLQRIKLDFVSDYLISLPPLEIQEKLIKNLKQDGKDKENFKEFIKRQKEKEMGILVRLWQINNKN